MKFGKHKGRFIQDLPAGYAAWIRRSVELSDDLADEFEFHFGGTFRREPRPWGRRTRSDPWGRHEPQPEPGHAVVDLGPVLRTMRRRWGSRLHPDHGGSVEAMRLANCIFDELETEISR